MVQGGPSDSVASIGRIGTRGVVPQDLPVSIAAPKTCSYTWTDPKSFCHVIFTGKLTSTPSFQMDTTAGRFLTGSLWQDGFPWQQYAEVTCTIDVNSNGAPYEKDCNNPTKFKARAKLLPININEGNKATKKP